MSKHIEWLHRIDHILNAINNIQKFMIHVKNSNEFEENLMLYQAVERNFEIIGITSALVPEPIKKKYPDVPWRFMKAQRNLISHQYDDVEPYSLWDTIQNDLPPLKIQMEEILQKETKNDN